MTYPLPEGTSANMVNVVSQVSCCSIRTKSAIAISKKSIDCLLYTLTHIQVVGIVMIVVVGQMSPNHVPIGTWFITGVTAFGALLTGE